MEDVRTAARTLLLKYLPYRGCILLYGQCTVCNLAINHIIERHTDAVVDLTYQENVYDICIYEDGDPLLYISFDTELGPVDATVCVKIDPAVLLEVLPEPSMFAVASIPILNAVCNGCSGIISPYGKIQSAKTYCVKCAKPVRPNKRCRSCKTMDKR
jgi:hypothetical protein